MNEINKNNHFIEDKSLNLNDVINKLIARKTLFFSIAIPFFMVLVLIQLFKPYTPLYRAPFEIRISQEELIGDFSMGYQQPQFGNPTLQRVITNLLSVKLAEQVVDTLSLYAYVQNGESHLKIETRTKQDFSRPLGPFKLKINGKDVSLFSKHGEKIAGGRLNDFIDLGVLEFRPTSEKEIAKSKTYTITFFPRDRMALALRNSVSVKILEADKIEKGVVSDIPISGEKASDKLVTGEPNIYYPSSFGMLRVNVYWANPDEALRIARVLADLVLKEDRQERTQQYIQSKDFIESQLVFYQLKLDEQGNKIRQFKKSRNIADLNASIQALVNQVSQIEYQKSQREIEEKILKNLNQFLATADNKSIDSTLNLVATLVADPIFQNFYAQFVNLEVELKSALKEYSSGHPNVLAINAKLDGMRDQMTEQIGRRLTAIRAEIDNVGAQLKALLFRLQDVSEEEIELARLEREKETADKLYTFFVEKLEEIRIKEAEVTTNLKIVNPPVVSSRPINARKTLYNIFVAFLVSIFLGLSAIFIAEYLDDTIKDPDTIKAKLGLPIFASIPMIDNAKAKKEGAKLLERLGILSPKDKVEKTSAHEKIRILNRDISSAEFEAFRKLSMNIDFAHPEKKYRVIYVTSPGPKDGKTFIALNLGVVLGISNKKVILIDTDFRKKRGHLTGVVKLKTEHGIFDVLKGEAKLGDTITSVDIEKDTNEANDRNEQELSSHRDALRPLLKDKSSTIDLLPIGKIPPNPFVFLESEKMKKIIEELKQHYDYLIIDGVPMLLFADATYLANIADGVLITATYGKTRFKELQATRDVLISSNSEIVGVVVNYVPRSWGSYYYHYYHKYYTKYYDRE